jgi:phosphinothricin acetyltransferase
MEIRTATKADQTAVVEIYNQAIPGRAATGETEPVSMEYLANWFNERDPRSRPLWVAEESGEVAGWLSLQSFYGRPAYQATAEVSVYVSMKHQRKGIGSALVLHALKESPRLGLRTLLAYVFAHNEASLQLFEGLGFERWGLLQGVAELDGLERDLVILGRKAGLRRNEA